MAAVQQLTLDDLTKAPSSELEPARYLGSLGAMCLLTDVLCWERWGYWSECGGPPAWASETLTDAKRAAQLAEPADVRYSLEFKPVGAKVGGMFRVWDEANPWAEPWSVNFSEFSEESARRQFGADFENHKRWQEEAVRVLIHYREHGELPPDGGKPEGQRYWLQPGYKPDRRVHLKEGQPGVVCYEKFENPDCPHSPGMIRVEIRAHTVDDWVADCYAERPTNGREVCGASLHGKTYAEAAALGRQWIEEVGRPHVTARPVE